MNVGLADAELNVIRCRILIAAQVSMLYRYKI